MFLPDNVVKSHSKYRSAASNSILNTDPGSATLIIIITKVRYATYGAQGTALRQSPSLPEVQHKDRSIRRARAHLVTARVPTHLHIRGYIKVSLYQCCGSGSGIRDRGSSAFMTRGSSAFMTPGSGLGKKSGSGSGMNNPDHISESLETFFGVKILKFFNEDPGSGMKIIRIRDGKNSDPGSGINIPDPQHC